MIFKSTTKRMQIKGVLSHAVKVSDELDLEMFYSDLEGHDFIIDKELFERFLLEELSELEQTGCRMVLVPGIYKLGYIASFNSDSRTLVAHQFSRPSPARYVNKTGKLQVVEPNMPRISYDSLFRNCKGYQFERGSVNLLKYSHGYISNLTTGYTYNQNNDGWGNILCKPSGVASASNFNSGLIQLGNTYVYSAYFKIEDGHKLLQEHLKVYIGDKTVPFTIKPISRGIYSVESVYQCEVEPLSKNIVGIEINPVLIDRNVYLLGEQLEFGTEASSYIQTDGEIAGRLADIITFDGAFSEAFDLMKDLQNKSYFLNKIVLFNEAEKNIIKKT